MADLHRSEAIVIPSGRAPEISNLKSQIGRNSIVIPSGTNPAEIIAVAGGDESRSIENRGSSSGHGPAG